MNEGSRLNRPLGVKMVSRQRPSYLRPPSRVGRVRELCTCHLGGVIGQCSSTSFTFFGVCERHLPLSGNELGAMSTLARREVPLPVNLSEVRVARSHLSPRPEVPYPSDETQNVTAGVSANRRS